MDEIMKPEVGGLLRPAPHLGPPARFRPIRKWDLFRKLESPPGWPLFVIAVALESTSTSSIQDCIFTIFDVNDSTFTHTTPIIAYFKVVNSVAYP